MPDIVIPDFKEESKPSIVIPDFKEESKPSMPFQKPKKRGGKVGAFPFNAKEDTPIIGTPASEIFPSLPSIYSPEERKKWGIPEPKEDKKYKQYVPPSKQLALKKPERLTQPVMSYPTHPYVISAKDKFAAGGKNFLQGLLDSSEKYGNIQKFITGANANPFEYQIPMSPEQKSILTEKPLYAAATKFGGEMANPLDLALFGGIAKAVKIPEAAYLFRKGKKALSLREQMVKTGMEMALFSGASGALQGELPTTKQLVQGGLLGAAFPVASKAGKKLGAITKEISELKKPFKFETGDPLKGWANVPENKAALIYEQAVMENKALLNSSLPKAIKGRNYYKAQIEIAVTELSKAVTNKQKKDASKKLNNLNIRLASSESEIENINAKLDKNLELIEQPVFGQPLKFSTLPEIEKLETMELAKKTGATLMPEKPLTLKKPWEMTMEEFSENYLWSGSPHPSLKSRYATDFPNMAASFAEQMEAIGAPSPGKTGQGIVRIYPKHKARFSTQNEYVLPDTAASVMELSAQEARGGHKSIIKKAIAEGKLVPPEVLKEYPDLVVKLPTGLEGLMPEKPPLTLPSRETMPIPEGGITTSTVKVTTPSIVTQKDVMDDVANFAELHPEILAPYFKLEGKFKLKYESLLARGDTEAAGKYLTSMTKAGNLKRTTVIASELIRKGEIELDMLPSVKKLIAEHGKIYDVADAAQWLLAQTKLEARGLGTQTAPAFRLRNAVLGMNLPNDIPLTTWDRIKMSQSVGGYPWEKAASFLSAINAPTNQEVMGFWKYSLVSRFATQARNYATTQYLMIPKIIEDAAVDTVSALTGKVAPKDALLASWENLSAMTLHLDRRGTAKFMEVLKANPYQEGRLFGRLGDISLGGKVSRVIAPMNEIQEFAARKQVMAATLWRDLRRAGKDPMAVTVAEVPPEMVEHAVNEGLRLTFGSEPSKNAQAFMRMLTFYPDDAWYKVIAKTVGNVTVPFPRFMAENMKMMYETTPVALLYGVPKQILEKAPMETVVRTAAKGAIGSTMFGMAWYIRNNPELRGENWYQVKIDGKNFDMRPFPLLSSYLFIADAVDTYSKGGADALFKKYQMRDIASVALGMNRIGGTTMFMADMVHGQNMDGFVANIKKLSGEFLGGFTTPAMNIKTPLEAFKKEEQKVRTTRENVTFGKAISNIPVLSQTLPQQPSIFGEGGKIKDRPIFGKEEDIQGKLFGAFQRMIGLVGKDEPELEKEMNRLGMKIFHQMPTKNDLRVDTFNLSERYNIPPETLKRMLAEKMDEVMQNPKWIQTVKAVLSDPEYGNMDDDNKMEALKKEIFSQVKKEAKDILFAPLENKYQQQQKNKPINPGGLR